MRKLTSEALGDAVVLALSLGVDTDPAIDDRTEQEPDLLLPSDFLEDLLDHLAIVASDLDRAIEGTHRFGSR